MPSINVDGAASRLLANGSLAKAGYCLFYVWGAISRGRVHYIAGGASTAYATWLAVPANSRHSSRTVPKDFPAFLGPRFGSSAGDVILSNGDGTFAATDWPSNRRVGICTLAQREAQTGRKFVGWASSMGGYDLVSTSTASDTISPLTTDVPVVIPKEQDMLGALIYNIQTDPGAAKQDDMQGGWFLVSPTVIQNLSASLGQFLTTRLNCDTIAQSQASAGVALTINQLGLDYIAAGFGAPAGTLESLFVATDPAQKVWRGQSLVTNVTGTDLTPVLDAIAALPREFIGK